MTKCLLYRLKEERMKDLGKRMSIRFVGKILQKLFLLYYVKEKRRAKCESGGDGNYFLHYIIMNQEKVVWGNIRSSNVESFLK